MFTPNFIVSDIDGTFINSAERVDPRVRQAVINAVDAGAYFSFATGRPYRWIYPILEQLPLRPLCVSANGAVIYDSETDTVIKTYELVTETMAEVIDRARSALAGTASMAIAVERAGHSAYQDETELFIMSPDFLRTWSNQEFSIATEDEFIQQPAAKMLLRCESMTASEMYKLIAPVIPEELAMVTYSMDEGLLEISAPGVSKLRGLEFLCSLYGVDANHTICFGDMPNDIEMLRWAGYGVAMGNAHPAVKAISDEVTLSNDEAGVAYVLERWFSQ
ncbi:HAD-family hydrolase [Corynebacterium kutscheri]|uniref:HAD-family hydrolase n=1 Tax=Corynebacterium kutscheri TaxID=35755 RepID=A0A0F6R167_9CORY|nr:Cof-type HAD-IIB family hydrolase [Corynebacterium kutscheri]AKE42142.1 HAD-superfamily hydrolase, subfamily IIB [Corynebacterium kutscheri]VEH05897.1 HAD-family hydrolase [Corynebacterium kutscheri]VEH10485.1 HAD-family hydrolase [Corynebacterium kutscheri]VEH81786.1 HAD-family hydrolase [Corynebacterium kutscheri]